jgi:lysophospholipase L1-like esterase
MFRRPHASVGAIALLLFFVVAAGRAGGDESPSVGNPAPVDLLQDARRILFLGDSITASGEYVADFDLWLSMQRFPNPPQVIDAGLSSETVSGLSEAGHAGGAFPRPDLFERLARVLAVVKPDLVFACYGINCGIYQPFDAERFERYQSGLQRLKAAVEATDARLIVITPPTYDDARKPGAFSYNGVLDRYSQWLVEQRANGWRVIDLHQAMNEELARRRQANPKFSFQPDAVHPDRAGHWFMAQQLIRYFGDELSAAAESPESLLAQRKLSPQLAALIRQRVNLLRDAYVTAAGHKRPGVAAGLPIAEAEARGGELTRQIQALLAADANSPAR